ncbi:MAG: tetratricopeptide repeat protein [Gemmatimonadaceae bacterium]
MKALQRHAVVAVVSVAVVAGAPARAVAQYSRNLGPGPDTPHLLIGTCQSPNRQLGIDAAAALRDRIQNENNVRDLYVVPNKTVNDALTASGYSPDSALSTSDLGALGKMVHADEILDCTVSQTPSGVHEEVRMLLANDVTQAQPLPAVDAKDVGAAAAQVEREHTAARKQLDGNRDCRNALRDGKPADAAKRALDAIRAYPQATLARLCLASAYADSSLHYPPDSVLAVTGAIMNIDPQNVFALRIALGAYDRKNDQEGVIQTLLKLYKLQPQDQTLATRIVDALAASPDPAKALPILDDMLKQNPGDPNMLAQKWKLQAKLNDLQGAIVTGEQMVRADTSLADSAYYHRQIAMATTDSNWAKVAQYAAEGEKKFPKDPQLPYLGGVALRNVKQLPDAAASFRQALALDPKNSNAQLYLAQTYSDLGQTDSVVAMADAALAAGGNKDVWGPMLLKPAQDAFTAAQADSTNAIPNYTKAYKYAMHADSLAPSKYTKFFAAVSAFQIGTDVYRRATAQKSCDLSKQANDLLNTTQYFLPEGGSVAPQAAASILQYLPQLLDATGKMVKFYCKEK